MTLERGKIYYINAKFKHKKKTHQLTEIVWKYEGNNTYNRLRVLKQYKAESVELFDIEIINCLGWSISALQN